MSFNPAGGTLAGASDVALSNPIDSQLLTYNGTIGKWQNVAAAPSATTTPYVVTPASGSVDIGALINTAFATYNAVIIAPGTWMVTTSIQIGPGQSLSGLGWQTSILKAASGLGANPVIQLAVGTAANFMLRDFEINANNIASYGFYGYATGAPLGSASPDASPEFTPIFQNVSVYGATQDGIYLGGSYSGGLRESRVMNCKMKHNGNYGLNLASSDSFISNCTTHGNGVTGYYVAAGNSKLVQCKAYFEAIGFDMTSVRCYMSGCEVQDCTTYGIRTAGQCFIECMIDTCGNSSTPALYVNGSGCSFAVHMVGRNPPNGNTINAGVQLATNTQIHAGFINTNFGLGGTYDYKAVYQNTNRPATGSALSVI